MDYNNPTLKCNGNILEKFKDNTNMYVSALTVDEMLYAGGKYMSNSNNYLKNIFSDFSVGSFFWNLSLDGSSTIGFYRGKVEDDVSCSTQSHYPNYARPAIILNSNDNY